MAKKGKKPGPRVKLPKGAFMAREPVFNGYILRSLEIPFTGPIRRLWIKGDYSGIWAMLRDKVPPYARLQSVRLVINGFLQKRALKPTVADFEQYMMQLVRISPTVTDGITGFSLRVVYKSKATSKHSRNEKVSNMRGNRRRNSKRVTKSSLQDKVSRVSGNGSKRKSAPKLSKRGKDGRYRDSSGRFAKAPKTKPRRKGGR